MSNVEFGTLHWCPKCLNARLVEFTIERHESWSYCNDCHTCWTHPMIVPKEQVIEWLKENGFHKDAIRVENGQSVSEEGQ